MSEDSARSIAGAISSMIRRACVICDREFGLDGVMRLGPPEQYMWICRCCFEDLQNQGADVYGQALAKRGARNATDE